MRGGFGAAEMCLLEAERAAVFEAGLGLGGRRHSWEGTPFWGKIRAFTYKIVDGDT